MAPRLRRRNPYGWLALVAPLVIVAAVVIGVLAVKQPEPLPSSSSAAVHPSASAVAQPPSNPLPDLGGPRSLLVPEVTLPPGARQYSGKPAPPGFEFWEVPGSYDRLVALMRSELPTHAELNGMPWCGEVTDNMTSWAWGFAADTIGVSLTDGGVMITRLPKPQGCRP
ncbi:MAG: hypothetical protein QOH60_4258 [Mycobacterium sp.]|jgi:hypothetical protein|nr:hypothetical protein [Mycobacterium sp.]